MRNELGRFVKSFSPLKHKEGCQCFRCTKIIWNKGKSWSKEVKQKISFSKKGKSSPKTSDEKHWNWKGDNAGYLALHQWISRKKRKAIICENCGSVHAVGWSNKSYEYKRDLSDWISLCQKCHMAKDSQGNWGIALKKFPDLKRYYEQRKSI